VDGFWNDANNFFHAGTSGQWEAILTTPEDRARLLRAATGGVP